MNDRSEEPATEPSPERATEPKQEPGQAKLSDVLPTLITHVLQDCGYRLPTDPAQAAMAKVNILPVIAHLAEVFEGRATPNIGQNGGAGYDAQKSSLWTPGDLAP